MIRNSTLRRRAGSDDGIATVVALIGLSLFGLLGLFICINAAVEVRVSDNYESHVEASYAAQAGLHHARELLKGLKFDDLLKGADGSASSSSTYLAAARTCGFRNLIDLATARSLDMMNPSSAVGGLADDGLLNTGKFGTSNGTVLIPATGIALMVPTQSGSGTTIVARYFVKVSDNTGEASEIAKDPSDDPFFDGDGIVIIRCIGIAQTIREGSGSTARANSVCIFEARYKQRSTFDLDAPMVVQGDTIQPSSSNMFNGNSFNVVGGNANVGIATIDINASSGTPPVDQITSQLAPNQYDNVSGSGLMPSVADITASVTADADKSFLLSQSFLYNFVTYTVPQFADSVYATSQTWSGGSAPYIGTYDYHKAYNNPSQDPKVVIVEGDLSLSGNISGGGLLVVKGKLSGSGSFNYNGIILAIGAGDIDMSGMNVEVHGGIYTVAVSESGGSVSFGTPKMTLSGNSDIVIDSQTVKMAVRLMPASQLGYREVTSSLDP